MEGKIRITPLCLLLVTNSTNQIVYKFTNVADGEAETGTSLIIIIVA